MSKRPRTEAERRAAEVKRRRGPRPPRDTDAERRRIEERTTERWVDDGPAGDDVGLRDAASGAAKRAGKGSAPRRRMAPPLDPDVSQQIVDAVGKQRGDRLSERLQQASVALDRERFQEARRLAAAIVKEVPDLAAGQQILGLANYRLGYWKPAIRALEAAHELRADPTVLPVLADSYRALGRWSAVDRVWLELRAASPAHEVLAEGRIVAAGALADQDELAAAIEVMRAATKAPKAVRDHHLRQWYVLADLYDRTGDTLSARRWFGRILEHDPEFADAAGRLRSLGR